MPSHDSPTVQNARDLFGPSDELTTTLPRASSITGLSISTLRRHAAANRLLLLKVGGRTLVHADSLRALLSSTHA
jgi:hypothetical protein